LPESHDWVSAPKIWTETTYPVPPPEVCGAPERSIHGQEA
jgi:hypothetical protein